MAPDPRQPVEQLLAAIVESTDDAVFSKDLRGTILSWNTAAERIYGYTAEEAIGRPVSIIVPPERRDEVDLILARVAAGEGFHHHETERLRSDGTRLHVSLSVSPLHGADGAVIGASVIGRDITDRVRAAQAAAEQEARVREVLERTTLLAGIGDLDGRIVHCNQALSGLVGRRPDEIVGMRWTDVFGLYPEDEQFYELLESGVVVPYYEGRCRTVDDELVIGWTNVGMPSADGRLELVASLGDNITARRAMEHALERARAERQELIAAILSAEAAERARIAGALHDDTIQVMVAALLSVESAHERHPCAALRRAGESLTRAIDRTRRLMFELCPTVLDEHGLARAIDHLCHHAALEAGFAVSVEIVPERFPTPIEELVFRTVREAVINARRHSRASRLQVRIAAREGRIEGVVTDDGIGFDPGAVRRRPGAELHLGLPAVAERLRLAHGDLHVESRPFAGTTIRFSVPAA